MTTQTVFSLGTWPRAADPDGQVIAHVDLTEAEYDALRQSIFNVVEFAGQQSFALVLRNYLAMVEFIGDMREHLDIPVPSTGEDVRIELRLVVLDWLLAAGLFLDHTKYALIDKLGEESDEFTSWDLLRQSEHASSRAYRILYSFRDYSAHAGMPPVAFHARGDAQGNRTFDVQVLPAQILPLWSWKAHTRTALEEAEDEIDFEPLAEEFMDCLHRLATAAQQRLAPNILDDARSVLDAVSRVSHLGGIPTLYELRVEEDGFPRNVLPILLPDTAAARVLNLHGQ